MPDVELGPMPAGNGGKKARKDKKKKVDNKAEMPSTDPDPSVFTEYKPINWKRVFFAPKYIPWWIVIVVFTAITVVITVKNDQVVAVLRPFAENLRNLPAGWVIPIVLMVILSFPPLFGHEIVALLCGVVWGLWVGFGLVAAGTFLGEIGTWFVFKYALRKKAVKLERTNLNYGAMARMTRDGGFWIVLIIRFSIIPSHISTAVFSTCDVKFWHFAVSTFLTLPKQLILVYLGVLLVEEKKDNLVQNIIIAITGVITIALGVWIWWKMRAIKKTLLGEQEQRRAQWEMEKSDDAVAMGAAGLTSNAAPYGETASTAVPTQTREYGRYSGYPPTEADIGQHSGRNGPVDYTEMSRRPDDRYRRARPEDEHDLGREQMGKQWV